MLSFFSVTEVHGQTFGVWTLLPALCAFCVLLTSKTSHFIQLPLFHSLCIHSFLDRVSDISNNGYWKSHNSEDFTETGISRSLCFKDYINRLFGHKSEVCGLKWSHDGRELASGGNNNQLLVWNQHAEKPLLELTEHTSAVKAITWSPHLSGYDSLLCYADEKQRSFLERSTAFPSELLDTLE